MRLFVRVIAAFFVIFASHNKRKRHKMKNPKVQRLTYGQIRDMLESEDNRHVSGYISENLAMLAGNPFDVLSRVLRSPFRFDEMRLIIVDRGAASPVINLKPCEVCAGDLVFVGGGGTVQVDGVTPDLLGRGISCADELLSLAFDGRLPRLLRRPRLAFVLHLSDADRKFLESLHRLLWQAVRKEMGGQVVLRLVSTILVFVDQLYARQEERRVGSRKHEEMVFDNFLSLVNQYGSVEHKLSFYADRLCLSPRHLGTLVRQVSGVTSKVWIDREMITSIKVDLRYTDKSLKEIASGMKFPNMSFFCKFFKRMTGMSPMEYRRQA